MHKSISFNRQICRSENSGLPAISPAPLYGYGIFTTIAIYNSKPFLWQKHWHRLSQNASLAGIDLSEFDHGTVFDCLSGIIAENNVIDGRARLTFFDQSEKGNWQIKSDRKTSLLITSADFRILQNGLRLTVSTSTINSKSPLAKLKSCNYLENLLALQEAQRRDFDEALRLNEKGEITSVCMANVFWLRDKKLYTPSLETGCLPGTTREFLLENHEVFEVRESLATLKEAEAIFLTSAGLGLATVRSLDSKLLPPSSTYNKLEDAFQNQIRNYK